MAQVEFNVPGPGTYLIEADPSLPPLSQPGTAADVLTGEQFYDEEGNPVTGTMPNNPAEAVVIQGGGSYTIPKGYHTGQGTVTSSGSVLPTLTDPADAEEIVSGKQAINQNGSVLTGTMPSNPAISETLEAGESYQVPAGYTPGGTVQTASLASQTPGTATQDDIIKGQTAWVNGQQITGALEPGSDTSDATATAADILEGETAYVATGKVRGTMPTRTADDVAVQDTTISVASGYYAPNTTKQIQTVEQAAPSISVSAGGLITATADQEAGFVADGTKSATQQLPVQGAQTITPGTTQQTINGGVYLTGTQTIQGDAGLVPDNIKNGITIFGVTGSYEGETGGEFAVPLTITVDSGVTVSAINGDTTLTAVSNGTAQFILPKGGTWTITATKDGETAVTTVTVQESYTGELEFIAGEVVYYGTATNIMAAYDIAGTSVGDYAIFAGGEPDGNHTYDALSTVYAFNSSLTRSSADSLPYNQKQSLGANFADHALIIGGYAYRSSTAISTHEIVSYDISLTRTLLESISRDNDSAAQTGNVLLISDSYRIEFYLDELLTLHEIEEIPLSSIDSSIDIGAYALFHNGLEVIAIDSSLTKQNLANLTVQRNNIGAAQNGVYALFAGGYYSSTYYNTVEAYDYSLTQTIAPSLTSVGSFLAGGRLGDFAVFSCCYPSSTNYTDVYDTSLTRESKDPLSSQRFHTAVANTGNYLLYGGGRNNNYDHFSTVDVYQLNITT